MDNLTVKTRQPSLEEHSHLRIYTSHNWHNCFKWLSDRSIYIENEEIYQLKKEKLEISKNSYINAKIELGKFYGFIRESKKEMLEIANTLSVDENLKQFYRSLYKLFGGEFYIAKSNKVIVPLISLNNKTLYLPECIIDNLKNFNMFLVNSDFYIKRNSYISWLLIDAFYINGANETGFFWELLGE